MNSTSSPELSSVTDTPPDPPQPDIKLASAWTGGRVLQRAKRLALYLSLSAVAHVLLLVAVLLIDFSTYIGSMRMPWSDRDLEGIGMAADPEEGDKTLDGEPVAKLTAPVPQEVVMQPPKPNPQVDPSLAPTKPPTSPSTSPPETNPTTNPPSPTTKPDDPDKKPSTAPDGKGTHPGETLPGLAAYGPGNVRIIFVIRNDRLRGTAYEETMRGLLKRFPDYQVTLKNSGLDPINDLDIVLIASNNLNRLEQTFVAIRHGMDDQQVVELFSKFYIVPLTWSQHQGRPRGTPDPASRPGIRARDVFLPEPGLALLIQTHLIDALNQTVSQVQDPNGTITQRSWLQTLRALEDIDALTGSNPAVFMSVKEIDISFNAKLPKMPRIVGITASITTDDAPLLTLKLEFNSDAEAATFVAQWPDFVSGLVSLSPVVFGIQGALLGFNFEQRGQAIYGQTTFPGFLVKMGLERFRDDLPDVNP